MIYGSLCSGIAGLDLALQGVADICYNISMSKESSARYRLQHLKEVRAKDRIRGKRRYHEDKEKMLATMKRSKRKLRLEAVAAYGGMCACCGESEPQFLAIDHIFNDGSEERRRLNGKRGAEFLRWLRAKGWSRDRYRLLCHNCNMSRSFYGQCPHVSQSV